MSWAKTKNIITTSATRRCVVKLYNFYGNVVRACVKIVVFEKAKCIVHEEIIERVWDSCGPLWETCIGMFDHHEKELKEEGKKIGGGVVVTARIFVAIL
jgi:hypothetical protein